MSEGPFVVSDSCRAVRKNSQHITVYSILDEVLNPHIYFVRVVHA